MIATIDFEASSLAMQGEPIEVGIALWERGGPIKTWSSLIYPADDILWSPESAEVHGITREELLRAPHPARVAERLNARMAASPLPFATAATVTFAGCCSSTAPPISNRCSASCRSVPCLASGLRPCAIGCGNAWRRRRRRTGLVPMLSALCMPMHMRWERRRVSKKSDQPSENDLMTLRIALSIVPRGIEDRAYQIGTIEI